MSTTYNPFALPPPTDPLVLVDVFDRGVPNMERVGLRATAAVEMRGYAMLIGVKLASGDAIPLNDNFFWFGAGTINPNDWIFLYTTDGKGRKDPIPSSTNLLYSVFWSRPAVIFSNPDIVPILIRVDLARIGPTPPPNKRLGG